jgi:ferredoxin, 2Fe-2S
MVAQEYVAWLGAASHKFCKPFVLWSAASGVFWQNPAPSVGQCIALNSEASIDMPKVIFVEHDGKTIETEAEAGQNLMQVALNNSIRSILADCGGNCACATCHVYIDAPWTDKVAPAEKTEQDMLECTLYPEATSRLGCQVVVTADLDGLVVRLPESQI